MEKRPDLYLRVWSDPLSDQAQLFVFPPDRPREGIQSGTGDRHLRPRLLQGTASYRERLRRRLDFLLVPKSGDGQDEPKATYIKGIDWEGNAAAIGAGIHRRDLPSTCWREEVNATQLDEHPSSQRLQEFVRCAAMELETAGYFGLVSLSTDPRWRSHSIYLFGVDMYGNTLLLATPTTGGWA